VYFPEIQAKSVVPGRSIADDEGDLFERRKYVSSHLEVSDRTLRQVSCLLLLSLITIGFVFPAANAQSARSTISLHLSVEDELLKSHKLRVTGEFSNLAALMELRLALGPSQTGRFYPITIEFLKAVDSKGQSLKVDHQPQSSQNTPDSWVLRRASSDSFQIEYLVTLNYYAHDLVDGYLGYAGTRYVVSWAGWVFLLPIENQWRSYFDGVVHVTISAPASWTVATPWEKQSDGTFVDPDYYHFQRATFGVGPYDVRSQLVDGTMVTVAADTGFDSFSRDTLAKYSFATFDYVFKLFRIKVIERYLVVYVTIPENGKGLVGLLEAFDSQGIGYYPNFNVGMIEEFEHRVFHTWNAFPPYGMSQHGNEEYWFSEGTNVYYEKVILDVGLIHEGSTLQYPLEFYQNEIVGTKYDIALAKASLDQPYPVWRLPYWKGALVSLMLDELVRKVSNGTRSMDDLLAIMYQRFRNQKCCYSNNDIIRTLNSLTGFDFSPFFAKYIYGNDRLPLKNVHDVVVVDWPQLLKALKLYKFPVITLTLSDTLPKVGQTVKVTAFLITADGKPIVNQTITFYLNSSQRVFTIIGSATTDESGLAILTFKVEVDRGTYQFVAYYAGSRLFSDAKEAIALTVLPAGVSTTTTTVMPSTTAEASTTSSTQVTWLEADWPFLVVILMVGVVAVVVLTRKPKGKGEER
jgi:predicted metalloprotease with PDZ domain